MNATRTALRFRALRFTSQQRLPNLALRRYAAETPPPHPPSSPPNPNHKEPSRVGAFYRTFSYPILKTFLGALFTYQLAYYVWLKLEVVEEKHEKKNEIQDLKEDLKEALFEQQAKAKGLVETVEEKVEGVAGEERKKGWWPW